MSAELFIRVDEAGRYQAYRLINGLYKLDVGAPFATPREAIDFCNGRAPRPVSHPDLARAIEDADRRDAAGAPTEAPDLGQALTLGPAVELPPSAAGVSRTCEACGGPLPHGSRSQRRTCDVACRQRAQYRRAHGLPVADTDATDRIPTLSERSEADASEARQDEGAMNGTSVPTVVRRERSGKRPADRNPSPVPTASAAASAHRLLAPARDVRPDSAPRAIGDVPNLGLI